MSREHISRKRFVRLAVGLGLGSAAVQIIAGCGEQPEVEAGPPASDPGAAGERPERGGPVVGEGEVIATTDEVSPGNALPFTNADTGKPNVLIHLRSGEFVAYSADCTHQRCTVAYRDGQLVCPCHGSVFDPANGAEVLTGPAPRPLPEIPIDLVNREIVRT